MFWRLWALKGVGFFLLKVPGGPGSHLEQWIYFHEFLSLLLIYLQFRLHRFNDMTDRRVTHSEKLADLLFVSIPVLHRQYTSRSLFALTDFGILLDCLKNNISTSSIAAALRMRSDGSTSFCIFSCRGISLWTEPGRKLSLSFFTNSAVPKIMPCFRFSHNCFSSSE